MNTQWMFLVMYSLPSMVATLAEPIAEFSDSYFLGQLGVDQLAALGGCLPVLSSTIWVMNFLMYVSSSSVASALGRGDYQDLSRTIKLTVMMSMVIGSIAASLMYAGAPQILGDFLGLKDNALQLGLEFFRLRILALPVILLFLALIGVLRGIHRVGAAFFVILGYALMTIILSWLFIDKLGLGMIGAAWANNLSFFISTLIILVVIFRDDRLSIAGGWPRFSMTHLGGFGARAASQFLRTSLIASVFILCSRYANRLGVHEGAAWQILLNFWLLPAYFLDGLSITATTIGADLTSRSQWSEWGTLSKRLIWLSTIIASIFSIGYLLMPNLSKIFSADETVFRLIGGLWPFLIFIQIPNAYAFIIDGLMFGLGKFGVLSRSIFIAFLVGFLPSLAITDHLNWGVGVPFTAMVCFYAVRIFLIHRFLRKKW